MKLQDFKVDGKYLDLYSYFISAVNIKLAYIVLPIIISLTVTLSINNNYELKISFLLGIITFFVVSIIMFIIGLKQKIKNNSLKITKQPLIKRVKITIVIVSISLIEIIALALINSSIG